MLHLIYCYFIINAFIAGCLYEHNGKWLDALVTLFFGIPGLIISGLVWVLERIDKLVEFRFLFFVIFTDRYRVWAEDLEFRQMLISWYPQLNAYKQWVLRIWAKKYDVKL